MRLSLFSLCAQLVFSQGDDEALFLRRIAEFWQEGEYSLAKSQIESFVKQYPESCYSDPLLAALGDLALREKNFSHALEFYSSIQGTDLQEKVFLNKLQCLFELQWHATLKEECEAFLQTQQNNHVTYLLAISLYTQALNAKDDPELLHSLAQQALPHFEALHDKEEFEEIENIEAHLYHLLKDYPKATELYLKIAERKADLKEDMLFQVALIQSEYDLEKAAETFKKIADLEENRAKEALYNYIVLVFDLQRFNELTDETLFTKVPEEKKELAKLFIAKSFVELKHYEKAINLLQNSTNSQALTTLAEAAFHAENLTQLDKALELLTSTHPDDPNLWRIQFSRAQVLKNNHRFQEAKEALLQILNGKENPEVLFELAQIDYKSKNWQGCYEQMESFLKQFKSHELAPFAWHYWISAASEKANEDPTLKPKLIADLETFLEFKKDPEWIIRLSQIHYELGHFSKAAELVKDVELPNAILIQALCHRENSLELFCEKGELALSLGAQLMNPAELHIALFNAYIDRSLFAQAADHLYAAFEQKMEISKENLLWLASVYLSSESIDPARIAAILEKCDTASVDLAKMYLALDRTDEAIAMLENLQEKNLDGEFLLAQSYAKKGQSQKASDLFLKIANTKTSLRSLIGAASSLEWARLQIGSNECDREKVATLLKNIVIQKTFEAEPICLEAALTYVDFLANGKREKRISLLQKIKHEFEREDDLLSKDYHAARSQNLKLNQVYQSYIQLIDAELLLLENKPEESKILLDQIISLGSEPLLKRAHMLLAKVDEQ